MVVCGRVKVGRGGSLLESAVLTPCLAWWELRSRSACLAMAMGSWPSYTLDMLEDTVCYIASCVYWSGLLYLSATRLKLE